MIVIRKYDKKGLSVRYEFQYLWQALAWLGKHFHESEWCWIFYGKESA